jgi:hypothetical protein
MGRKTRAAARAQETDDAPQTDDASSVPLPSTPSKHDRGPLRSITPNNAEHVDVEAPAVETDDMTKPKGKKGKKFGWAKKGKKAKGPKSGEQVDEASPDLQGADGGSPEVGEDEDEGEEELAATSGAPTPVEEVEDAGMCSKAQCNGFTNISARRSTKRCPQGRRSEDWPSHRSPNRQHHRVRSRSIASRRYYLYTPSSA